MRLFRAFVVAPFALLAMGMLPFCQTPDPLEPNEAPIARVVWPQIWLVTEPVPFDASQSEDTDGVIQEVSMVFGDGTEEQVNATGAFDHLYVAPGTYEFRVEVRDDHGAPTALEETIVVVENHDDPLCDCELPCLGDAVCTDLGCFLGAAAGEASDAGGSAGPRIEGALACP